MCMTRFDLNLHNTITWYYFDILIKGKDSCQWMYENFLFEGPRCGGGWMMAMHKWFLFVLF